jgi:hypothetical protein
MGRLPDFLIDMGESWKSANRFWSYRGVQNECLDGGEMLLLWSPRLTSLNWRFCWGSSLEEWIIYIQYKIGFLSKITKLFEGWC